MALILEKENDLAIDIDTLWQRVTKEPIDNDVGVIILKQHHLGFNTTTPSFDLKLWGKSVKQWVCLAFDKCPIMEINYNEGADILQTIRPYLSDKKYTAVFYADTPLFQRKTFLSVLDYVQTKRLNVCKLERGYIFVTDYIRTAERLYSTTYPNLVDKDEFLIARNMDTLEQISQMLKARIIDYHLRQGVQIIDRGSVSIDADVVIGNDVIIYPNNTIEGASVILDGVVLYTGNVIVDSKIGQNSTLRNSVIIKSDIAKGSELTPFSVVDNGIVKK